MQHAGGSVLGPHLPRSDPMVLHHLTGHPHFAVSHALHLGRVGPSRRRLRLERLFKVGHARRHPIGENWPGADGKDAKGCERSDNRCFLAQI